MTGNNANSGYGEPKESGGTMISALHQIGNFSNSKAISALQDNALLDLGLWTVGDNRLLVDRVVTVSPRLQS